MRKLLFIFLVFSSCYSMKSSLETGDFCRPDFTMGFLDQFNHSEHIYTSDDLDDYFEVIKASIRLNIRPRTAYLLNCSVSWSMK